MRKLNLLSFVFLFFYLQLAAQKSRDSFVKETEENRFVTRSSNNHLLNGTFIKETSPTRNVEYNDGFRKYYQNRNFGLNKTNDTYFIIVDDRKDNAKQETAAHCYDFDSLIFDLNKIPKKLKKRLKDDFVFIEPYEKYYRKNQKFGFISRTQYFIIDESLLIDESLHNCYTSRSASTFPYSLRFYINPKDIEIIPRHDYQFLDSNFVIPNKSTLLQPFLFHKYEVTNREYREFVNWVRDSIAREVLYDEMSKDFKREIISKEGDTTLILNWKKELNWQGGAEKEVLDFLFDSNDERFYSKRFIDSRKLNYKSDRISTLNIYPDTMCWVNDFEYSFNEPLTNSYFWHPVYAEYPVVGINYWKVQAFLDWKTKQHQKILNQEGYDLKVTYALPTDFQWDLVATAEMSADTIELFSNNYQSLSDKDWITNLKIKSTTSKLDSIGKINETKYYSSNIDELYLLQNNANRFDGNLVVDKSLQTAPVNINELEKKKRQHLLIALNKDSLGICYMGANVSEWMDNDYKTQWQPIFDLRQQQLATSTNKSIKILSEIEKYYDQKNAKDGKLVRGGNWYDERFSNLEGKNIAGINAKTFVSPDSEHSTIGFRYVITFEEK